MITEKVPTVLSTLYSNSTLPAVHARAIMAVAMNDLANLGGKPSAIDWNLMRRTAQLAVRVRITLLRPLKPSSAITPLCAHCHGPFQELFLLGEPRCGAHRDHRL